VPEGAKFLIIDFNNAHTDLDILDIKSGSDEC
jgi:hypothetical protein